MIEVCALCGLPPTWDDSLDRHHIFGGPCRRLSEQDGLVVPLHHYKCHIYGERAVHRCRTSDLEIKQKGERAWLAKTGKTQQDFVHRYGRNYL